MRPLLLGICVLVACAAPREEPKSLLHPLPSPAAVSSGEPYLLATGDDALHMTWIEKGTDSTNRVAYARYANGAWTSPATIVARKDLFVNWADFPAVTSTGSGQLIAHWLQRSSAGGKYAYDIMFARSADSGRTWSEGRLLHTDTTGRGEHGFVAWWADANDSVHAAWLDGRHMGGGHGESRGAMAVYHRSVAASGALGTETPLDLRTCECCQVNATVGRNGPIIVYRDRSDSNIRDIATVAWRNGKWTEPAKVHTDNWYIEGCPVNGPSIAARGDTAVVAWFTGAQDTARVRVAWSSDGGVTFGPPIRADGGSPVGRVDIELLSDGSAALTWLERVPPEQGEVRIRRVLPDGSLGSIVTVATTAASRPSGFPKLARVGDDLFAAWTQPGDSARVTLARMRASDLPKP